MADSQVAAAGSADVGVESILGPIGTSGDGGGLALGSVEETLSEIARIGASTDGGATRLSWSPELFSAYRWVAERMRALGLEVEIDAAGNLIGRWNVGSGKAIAVGSHLDTVPSGGPLDGVLGVVGAVHAVAMLQEEGFEPQRPLWIIAFMDEEGTRFNAALFGSRAFTGNDVTHFGDRVDANGVSLREAMAAAGRDIDLAAQAARIDEIGAFIEMHIEQGPRLEAEELDIGVVTSIVGMRGYRVRFEGQANHAGTTPMPLRRDALAGAARVTLELREFARARESITANVGKIDVRPGGANVVPGVADFTIDVRAPTPSLLAEIEGAVDEVVARVAREERLDFHLEQTFALEPLELDPALVAEVERAAEEAGARWRRMPSGAGHDAMLVGHYVPAAMLFVPSRDGISHSPDEYSPPAQVALGTRTLAGALRTLLRTS